MLRERNFHLAQPCVGVAQFCDALLVRGYLVLIVSAIGLPVSRRPRRYDGEEIVKNLRGVSVQLSRRFCSVNDGCTIVRIDFAWVLLFDLLLFRESGL